jgi:uncharacterized membrane-anchored protein YhcB (DUF1043 family)
MDAATATVIAAIAAASGVAIGSLISFFGTWLNNRNLRQQQREQREHEEKRAQIEAENKRKIAEIESQDRLKTTLHEVYANSAKYLAEIQSYLQHRPEMKYKEAEIELHDNMAEANHWLTLLAMIHYDKSSHDFSDFYDNLTNFSSRNNLDYIQYLRDNVLDFAKNDPRLK